MDSPEKIDKFISAEFPGNRHPNEEDSDRIGTLVEDLMVHAPCYRQFFSLTLMHGKNINVCEHVKINRKSKCFSDIRKAFCQQRQKEDQKDRDFPRCVKDFPKEFADFTSIREDGKVMYKRTDNGNAALRKNAEGKEVSFYHSHLSLCPFSQVEADNRWIVTYNPYLLAKYESHINVEAVSKVHVVKYIYKYIFKVSFSS